MTELVDYVDANWEGEKRRFRLRRERIRAYEQQLDVSLRGEDVDVGRSAYGALKRLSSAAFTFADVEATLSFALATQTSAQRSIEALAEKMKTSFPAFPPPLGQPLPYTPDPTVRAVLLRDGHAAYAGLAHAVLAAAALGIRPEDADFDGAVNEAA